MKITININDQLMEDLASFELREMTPQIQQCVSQLQNLDFKLIAHLNERKYRLDLSDIVRIYAAQKRVYVEGKNKQEFVLNQSLSSLDGKLPPQFLRISNSEIVNSQKIKSFEFTFGGKIKIVFENDRYTYSSRSYLSIIKEYFGL
jgi:DNA-binding LytR/AlgR family response regulator